MHTPVFSIIVPVYKVENYLDICVQSLINQTFDDIEIILVDDGSPDSCPARCDAFAAKDARVHVIHQANRGLSAARNAGLMQARGSYVLFVDSDDVIDLDTCQRLIPFTNRCPDIIIGDGISTTAGKKLSHGHTSTYIRGDAYMKLALRRGSMPMAAVLYIYRREFLRKNHLSFKSGILHEDEQFTPRAFLAADNVVESNICFYHYVIRADSITTQCDLRRNAADLYDTCLELAALYEQLSDHELKNLLLDSLVTKYLSLFQVGKLQQYGKAYIHKRFVLHNGRRRKTICKALLFAMSPNLYWHVNHMTKRRRA